MFMTKYFFENCSLQIYIFFKVINLLRLLQIVFPLSTLVKSQKVHIDTRKQLFQGIGKVLKLGLKVEKKLQNENHTEDWALGGHPRDSLDLRS